MDRENCLNDILFTCENYSGYLFYKNIRAWQIPSEIIELLKEVKENGTSTVLEIGTYEGGTLYLMTRFLECQKIITIDLPGAYQPEKQKFFKVFGPDKDIYLLQGSSQSEEIIKKVSCILKDDYLDFIFIDGDHSYEGVKKDFYSYKNFVRDGGIIAIHDIVSPYLGVTKFWNEIKDNYASREILAPIYEMLSYARSHLDKQGWGGIGIIYKSSKG